MNNVGDISITDHRVFTGKGGVGKYGGGSVHINKDDVSVQGRNVTIHVYDTGTEIIESHRETWLVVHKIGLSGEDE